MRTDDYSEISSQCQTPRLRGWLYNRSKRLYMRCPCGRWRCAGCGRHKARTVARRFLAMGPTHHMVVTLAGQPEERRAKIGMRRLRRWMVRHGLLLLSGWVREYGEHHGRLHFHCLVLSGEKYWPFAELQAAARRCGLGNLDISEITDQKRLTHYVTKYIAKDLVNSLGNGRRFYCQTKLDKSGQWEWCGIDYYGGKVEGTPYSVRNRSMRDLPPRPPLEWYDSVEWKNGVLYTRSVSVPVLRREPDVPGS